MMRFNVQGTDGACSSGMCCRSGTPSSESSRAGRWGYVGHCDLPVPTLNYFLNTTLPSLAPDIIFWLGDNSCHGLWGDQKEEHLKVGLHVANSLLEAGYNQPGSVYPILGNHESIPSSQYDPRNPKTHQWMRSEHAKLWENWLTPAAKESFTQYGWYSQMHGATNLKIIGLSSFSYDLANTYLWPNSTNPDLQLEWLEHELYESERLHHAVFILTHIPTNDVTAIREWGFRYAALVERYANIIRGQFSGHTHLDNFLVTSSRADPNEPVSVQLIHPSFTSYTGLNPSFRVYEVDTETFVPVDYTQYRLYLSRANLLPRPVWEIAYKFTEFYGVRDMSPASFREVIMQIRAGTEVFKKAAQMWVAEGPVRYKQVVSSPNASEFLYCFCTARSGYEMAECAKGKYVNSLYLMGYEVGQKYLVSPWFYVAANQQ